MRILITGAFGNIGKFLIKELSRHNYRVVCFVLPTLKNKKVAKNIRGINIVYGDIRKKEDIKIAIKGCDVVIHLVFTSPGFCQKKPVDSFKTNVGGTENLVEAIRKSGKDIRIIFPSSISTYFYDRYKKKKKIRSLRYFEYTKQKIECEKIIKSYSFNWVILRIGAILPVNFPNLHNLLDIPFNTYFQFIYIKDVIIALINSIKTKEANKKVLLIGGKKEFCLRYKDFVNDLFSIAGKKNPSDNCFILKPYLTNCFNTKRSQKILNYQKHYYKNFLRNMRFQIKKQNQGSF